MRKLRTLSFVGKLMLFIGVLGALLVPCAAASPQTYTEQKTVLTPFSVKTIEDDTKFSTDKEIITQGFNGSRNVTYEVTKSFGSEMSRGIVNETTIVEPIEQVERVGIIVKTEVTESESIPYEEQTVDDPSLATGLTQVIQQGSNGKKEKTYEIQTLRGVEKSKTLINETVTNKATPKITKVGTYVQQSYSRSGAICSDGWTSSATGRGACSHHGGVSQWTY